MMSFRVYCRRHKYRLAMYALLGAATVFCLILVRVRLSENDGTHYSYLFLVKNLTLAWIPFLIALVTRSLALPRRVFRFILPVGCVIWLIFFPNAPYLLTDFQHLRLFSDSPQLWFDVIMVTWFALTGLFLGLVSLFVMHGLVRRELGPVAGWAFVFFAALLSSAGIFAGRFVRINSWDILRNPVGWGRDLVLRAGDSGSRAFGFISLYTFFLLFIYVMFHIFGNLLQEESHEQP